MFTLPHAIVIAIIGASNHMAVGRITKSTVDAALPGERDWMMWDDKLSGFGLKVTPKGSKVFIFQYRMGGRGNPVRRYTIGRFGNVTPDAARKIAEDLSHSVSKGTDPQREKVETTTRAIDLAFKGYVERFASECLESEWASTHAYAHSLLTKYAVPVLGNKGIHQITKPDIRIVCAKARKTPATERNLYGVLRRMFTFAVDVGDIQISPILGMKPPAKPASRDRVLEDYELKLVWNASQALGKPFGPLVRLLVVTAARRDEVAGMDWAELKRGTQQWNLPSSRSKNGTAVTIMLSSMAIAELDAMAGGDEWPRSGLVFSTTGKTAVSGFSRSKRRLDKEIAALLKDTDYPPALAPWRYHDLRRTVATGLQRLGVRFEVTESVLNHVGTSKGGVAGIYQRHDWADEKRAAVAAWAVHLNFLLTDKDESNVVQLASASADTASSAALSSLYAERQRRREYE